MGNFIPGRLAAEDQEEEFRPALSDMPPLPPIDWGASGLSAPSSLDTPTDKLPIANTVIVTWTSSEWTAMNHVFCASQSPTPYSAMNSSPDGWVKYDSGTKSGCPSFWGYYKLVEVGSRPVLLFKSNTHLDEENGQECLETMVAEIIGGTDCDFLLSIGTSGGTKLTDHVGAVKAVSAGTLYDSKEPQTDWPVYGDSWNANPNLAGAGGFGSLLVPVPTTSANLTELIRQLNEHYSFNYSLLQVDPLILCKADIAPQFGNDTGGAVSLLTASGFLVGTTSGSLANFACVEEDDAIVGKACKAAGIDFGFVRNISDPVQNVDLPSEHQRDWASAVYQAYGLYTSYNGALFALASL